MLFCRIAATSSEAEVIGFEMTAHGYTVSLPLPRRSQPTPTVHTSALSPTKGTTPTTKTTRTGGTTSVSRVALAE